MIDSSEFFAKFSHFYFHFVSIQQVWPFCGISMKSTKNRQPLHFAIRRRCTAAWLKMLAMTFSELVRQRADFLTKKNAFYNMIFILF